MILFHSRYRPVKGKQEEWKAIVEKYRIHQDIENAIEEFSCHDWVKQLFHKKSRRSIQLFKEHVSVSYLIFCISSMMIRVASVHFIQISFRFELSNFFVINYISNMILQAFRYLKTFSNEAGYEIAACHRYSLEGHIGGRICATQDW